jgi:hypothetical protein
LSTFTKAEEGSYSVKCGHTVEMDNSTICSENHISGDKKYDFLKKKNDISKPLCGSQ